ncbi:MAG: hypothetical protein SRB1_02236 [Desulfobacteraceae bacterium Eth-SRB1]|nr:MAG: hypothetical protein SRB1_02236 [Desulfobacteraceae bacterium Eth-SRB1]
MKYKTSYVFPNISAFNRNGRGGLHKRYEIAVATNCSFIEVPADFIKNKTEVQLTGKKLGSILTAEDVEKLYEFGTPSEKVKYILHTEPSLSRSNGTGTSITPPLLWNNRKWVSDFIEMTIAISKRFKIPPAGIEIHPGGRNNTNQDLIRSIMAIRAQFEKTFKIAPFVVVENRTGQFISNGDQIADFWEALLSTERRLSDVVGVVLDIQQLYTATKNAFLKQLKLIPHKSVKGLHIHCRHRTPSIENKIPWESAFPWVGKIKHKIFVNPEVHHQSQANDTISFCNKMMR